MRETDIDRQRQTESQQQKDILKEEEISDQEDRMVEFTAAEQNKEKRMKRNEDSRRTTGTTLKATTFTLYGSQKEKRERKDPRKYLKRLESKTSLTWERK